jgi:hypothetical protein
MIPALAFCLPLPVFRYQLFAGSTSLTASPLTALMLTVLPLQSGISPYPLLPVYPPPLPATDPADCQLPFPHEPKELLFGATNAVKSAFIHTASFFSRQREKHSTILPLRQGRSAEERDHDSRSPPPAPAFP